ncbi:MULTISPECIES: hypothetical protein [unclassified Oceanispirochaeta]|uniref:hypothetical protein n=1 Tax=unclassified Oceanispirochaeta TaxID=2635722 RepID=UPI000E098004|nr:MULTISPECIES: hypothetical protein [unclassified Oceanispirochaeta]MBF9015640.1 hypothetical protein [Oceanispirochaeta sp. M2]NPD73414.1 hypothetical protein [Oceanispirochaeta sp. M1]RDG30888.1 hypothetical protein DV872_15030 [Oceanispirochaeta sp. M1]
MPEANENAEVQETKELPSVFQMDLPKREEFLSQVGSFTQEQRRIFHRICDFFDPSLDYNRFVLHAGKDILFANNQIEILMKKIKNAHYGLLKFQVVDGELKPNRIVITNRDSIEFYTSLIDDEIQRNLLDESKPFLAMEELEEQNLTVPFDFVDSIGPEVLSPAFIKKNKEVAKIYSMKLKTGATLIIASGGLESLVTQSQIRIRGYLKNTSFISIVSRFMGIKISDIQKKMSGKDPRFWQGLSTKVLQNREDLQLRLKHLEASLFQASEILHHYYMNSASEEANERKENAARDAALEELCMEILRKENFIVSEEELNKMIKPLAKKWEGFRDLFFERSVKVTTKVGLPPILGINGHYIHRDHVYPYFRSELSMQGRELRSHYIQLMERMLRTGNKDRITTFYTRETFNDDIIDMIRIESPVLAELLKKPRIISEAIVHYFKNLKKVRDVSKIKDFMNNFFDKGVIKFKEPDHLLDLYLLEIFEEAYRFLSWWRKLFLRLSGKRDGFHSQYSGLGDRDLPDNALPNKKKAEGRNSGAQSSGSRYTAEPLSRRRDSSKTTAGRRRHTPPINSKQYNLKQRNRAWTEFEDAFGRKN